MPINRNALIRYKVLDSCLQRRNRKWTLEDLIEKVSDALYEYEGMDKGISKRTIQADIQMMRSDKLGYFAPIIVSEKKYYAYEDPNYSITNIPLSENDLSKMNEAVELLKQFKGFSHFSQLNEVIQKLEDHVYSSSQKQNPVIDFEKNEQLKGLNFLDQVYQAIINKKVIEINYQSFSARQAQVFQFHVWWLKEYKNRWFAVGVQDEKQNIINLALDRFLDVKTNENLIYLANSGINTVGYYKNVIGVTVDKTLRPQKIKLWISSQHAPYIETKPLHESQILIEKKTDGIIIEMEVQHNFELEREILGFGDGITVLSPPKLRDIIKKRLGKAKRNYEDSINA